MPTNLTQLFSLIFSILLALPLFPGALLDYVQSAATQNGIQAQRLESMQNGNIRLVDEQSFANFDLNDTSVKYNEVRTLHTHNSYKKALPERLSDLSMQVFGPDMFKSALYEHDTPIVQLENGVRGLELDIRWQPNGFKIFHVAVVDKLSNSPDWKLTLEELKLWSNANPTHVPITILIEMKHDKKYLNPLYGEMNAKRFAQLDETISTIMGDEKVVTASELMGSYPTLGAMVEDDAWPTLHSMKGKFIFLLHPDDEYTQLYVNMDPSLKTQMMVPAFRAGSIDTYTDAAAFIIYNTPHVEAVKELVDKHYMVRVFMDYNQQYNADTKANALAGGAQMLTTDLEKGLLLPQTDYEATLDGEYTIIN